MKQTQKKTVSLGRQMLNKVPEVTVFFWIIKVLATTVGETAADYLNTTLGLGLSTTSYVMSALLIVALVVQFATRRYIPTIYWLAVVLISVVGTLITDNLAENFGLGLPMLTTLFAILLAVTFAVWFAVERTLSIHTIVTSGREGFYWLTVLFTFALGTAAGDLVSERFALGYLTAAIIFGLAIGVIAVLHYVLKVNAVLTFWLAYILTRPFGASIGDYLSQDKEVGGLGLGSTTTSLIFLGVIAVVVAFLTVTRKDATPVEAMS